MEDFSGLAPSWRKLYLLHLRILTPELCVVCLSSLDVDGWDLIRTSHGCRLLLLFLNIFLRPWEPLALHHFPHTHTRPGMVCITREKATSWHQLTRKYVVLKRGLGWRCADKSPGVWASPCSNCGRRQTPWLLIFCEIMTNVFAGVRKKIAVNRM